MTDISDEDLVELGTLVTEILARHATVERLQDLEAGGATWDQRLWEELATAGIPAIVVPEAAGGMGLGIDAVCTVLRTQGTQVAPAPLWTTLVAHCALAEAGPRWSALLGRAAAGEVRTTLALEEPGNDDLLAPRVDAVRGADGWALTGSKVMVPHAGSATHAIVTATAADGPGLFLLAWGTEGASVVLSRTTNRDVVARLDLDGATAERVGDGGQALLARLVVHAWLALSALQIGIAEGALHLTSRYVSDREQFGRPIGSFQSLQHQLADCSIAIAATEATLALALADASGASALRSACVASWWARETSTGTVYACQHAHGGIGVDVGYPLHRFFLWGRQAALTLGDPETMLERLGDLLPDDPGAVA